MRFLHAPETSRSLGWAVAVLGALSGTLGSLIAQPENRPAATAAAAGSTLGANAAPAPGFELREGDRVALLGDALIEGEQYAGWIEVMLTTRFADRNVHFRNLGWNADTPAGDSRFGLSLLQAGREPADEGWKQLLRQLEELKPTVIVLGYGMASSFDGELGLARFNADYRKLLAAIDTLCPGVRLVFLGPIRHEALGSPWPDPAAHNRALARYETAVRDLATERGAPFVGLSALKGTALTKNGIHLTDAGYRSAAESIEDALFSPASAASPRSAGGAAGEPRGWRGSSSTEALRQAILRKNEAFFHRSRPANMAYIFGFRKAEQGRNAAEVLQFDDELIASEKRIAALRALAPADLPEAPLRVGNRLSVVTAQPPPHFNLADGLEVSLWAENPQLNKPIQMNFDPQGRLWVASSEVYPQIEPGQAATDKIIVLEDVTGAGHATRATVFAEGLLIPTGVTPGDGGCYVAQSTELLHFSDTDGDGRADRREVVLSGFGTEDTHHNLHTLKWGLDGRLYMNQSVYTRTNTETPHGVVRLKAGGIFRFDPRNQALEILYRGWVNAWGHQIDDYGQAFVTDGAGFAGVSWAVPGATYLTLAPARRVLESVSPGRYPKFAGIEIVRSAHFPADWQGDIITCDFRAHRIVRFKANDQGAGYITQEMPDVMRTVADSFRPVDVKLGPDGALYIADWSNPIIQHGEVDFRDTRRDKVHGRIWRLSVKGSALQPKVDLTRLASPALLDRLISPNGFEREQSRRVLVERGASRVLADLTAWTARQTTDRARLEALWMHQAFNAPVSALSGLLLASTDPRVRAAAVRALPASEPFATLAKYATDENPRVRLEAVRQLGRSTDPRAPEVALAVLDRPMDPFIDYALWLTINELVVPWTSAVKAGTWSFAGREKQLEFALKSIEAAPAREVLSKLLRDRPLARDGSGPWIELIGSAGGPAELDQLLDLALNADEAVAVRALRALTSAARLRTAKPEAELSKLTPLLAPDAALTVRTAALPLVGYWKLTGLQDRVVAIASRSETGTAASTGGGGAERTAAFAALRELGGESVIQALAKLAHEGTTPEVRREAAVTLAGLDLKTALPVVLSLLQSTTDEAESLAFWRALLAVKDLAPALGAELAQVTLPKEVAKAGLRPAREGKPSPALVQALMKQAGLSLSEVQLSPVEMQQLAEAALARGDAAKGERIYRSPELACTACHAIGGVGGKLGPDLTSIGASAPTDYLVESLLYPNAKVKEGYHAVSLSTQDQQEISGMIARESATEVVVRNAANQEISVPVNSIVKRSAMGSLMPAGLIDSLMPEDRLDLVKFLAQLGKPGAYDAGRGGVARLWRVYRQTSKNAHLGVERVVQGDFSLPDWEVAPSLVSGVLPRSTWAASMEVSGLVRELYAATQFKATGSGPTTFTFSGGILGAWLNDRPVTVNATTSGPAGLTFTVQPAPGINTLVLLLDDRLCKDGIKLEAPATAFATD